MAKKNLREEIPIPEGIEVVVAGPKIQLKGKAGQIERNYSLPGIRVTKQNSSLVIQSEKATKRENKVVKTIKAHIKNMIMGSQEPFVYTLKVCSGHFPITVTSNDKRLEIKNLFGEKTPRILKLKPGAKVSIEADIITVTSPDKELSAQVAADIESLSMRSGFDSRVFQDGIYITKKGGKTLR